MTQTTDHVLMVRPVNFAFNEQTAVNNAFQKKPEGGVAEQAIAEFDAYVALLRQNGVTVDVLQDSPEPPTPDSIFPNNCFSTHRDKNGNRILVLYPMFAQNRQQEREKLVPQLNPPAYDDVMDLRNCESKSQILEGTGSLVLDREHRIAYACLSPRTNEPILLSWAKKMDYSVIAFESFDNQGTPVYHTNVMMHVGTRFAVVCLDSVRNPEQHANLVRSLEQNGKQIINISLDQMNRFAGNMLELRNPQGEKLLIMSNTAYQSLTPNQISLLETDLRILAPDIHTIETVGGGSARCMLAELF